MREVMGDPLEIELLPNGGKKLSYSFKMSNVKKGAFGNVKETEKWSERVDVFIGTSGRVDRYEKIRSDEFGAAFDLFRQANAANTQGDLKKALAMLNKLLDSNPNYLMARVLRAGIYTRLENREAAAEDYKIIVKSDPGNAIAYHNLGVIYYEMGDTEASIQAFNEALRSQPNYAVSQAYRARSFAKQGKEALAKMDITSAQQNGFVFDKKLKDELKMYGVETSDTV